MTPSGKKVLAVVPARAGSRSIPNKNLLPVNGLSLVGHAILLSLDLPWIDDVVLSTDSEIIAAEGRRFGASVPFIRPAELATDTANSKDVWRHAFNMMEQITGKHYEISILLEPTSPMRTGLDIIECISRLENSNFGCIVTLSRTPGSFTPEKTLVVEENGGVRSLVTQDKDYTIRQSIPAYYHRNGLCYAIKRKHLLSKSPIIAENCGAVLCNRTVVNIDEPLDYECVKILLGYKDE
jgi:CMP-N,N'-diacetyllegionaminic acid synthase